MVARVPASPLVADSVLEASAVVANSDMNRDRGLAGANSYQKELGVDLGGVLADLLGARTDGAVPVAWLDVCCGRGRALLDAARRFEAAALTGRIEITGLDLVDHVDPAVRCTPGVSLAVGSVGEWRPDRTFDLVTCVHGLHYVGDKLRALSRMASWLGENGTLIASFDLAAYRWSDGTNAGRSVAAALRAAGFTVDARRHRISLAGRRDVELPFTYLGSDPNDGPNYTGQPAVASYYARTKR
jgi:SAM-dependent methyltransferase